jgi:RNA polymerase sigma-70 factor (ECF subfamily)
VVAEFHGALRRFVGRRVPGPDADDVLQDTLLRIHLGIGGLRSSDHLAPWVYRVARSAIIDHHRKQRPTFPLVEGEVLPAEPEAELRPLLLACLEPFLAELPPDQALALRLTELGGLTQVQAAAQLGVPLPTLKARVQRGRRHLRASFDACCALVVDGRGAVIEATPKCGCG